MLENASRVKWITLYLRALAALLFFWWPASHWLYPDGYHRLLGFVPGSCPPDMVRIIGACGLLPVMLAWEVARDPLRYRVFIAILIVFALVLALTYAHLILGGWFPRMEWINVALSLFSAAFLGFFFPRGPEADCSEKQAGSP